MPKTVRLYGRTLVVAGSDDDDYFRNVVDASDATDSLLRGLRPYVADDAVCIDVGANIGLYSLALSILAPRGVVYAFEPSPSAIGYLRENVRANCVANVEVSDMAIADRCGTAAFQDFSFFSAGSFISDESPLLTSESYGSAESVVSTITLDDFAAGRGLARVDFVKIDVEGAELLVLAGAERVLARDRPMVVLEFNSFGFTNHQSTLPQVALSRIRSMFPHVYVFSRADGSLSCLETPREEYEFLYDNDIYGPADNFLCSFRPLDVTRRYSHFWKSATPDPGLPAGPRRLSSIPGGTWIGPTVRRTTAALRRRLGPVARRTVLRRHRHRDDGLPS